MRNYGPVLLLAAVLCCFSAWNSRAQSHADASYELVGVPNGPWIYRMNSATGDVCAIKTIDMDYAYKSRIRECASGEQWRTPAKD